MFVKRVIVVDDDPQYIEMLSQFAELFDISYCGFTCSEDLFAKELWPNDLILLDVYMPGRDGLDILNHLNDSAFEGFLAIMSGASEDVLASLASYMDSLNIQYLGRLDKPVKLVDLKSLLNKLPQQRINIGMTVSEVDQFAKVFNIHSLPSWFEHGFIYPVFQPQVCVKSNSLVGIECLVRISHPDTKNIKPATFIRLIEGAGLITEYTLLMVKTALASIKDLLEEQRHMSCSFNVSALSLDAKFVDALVAVVKKHKVSPSQITIELTETSAISMTKSALYAISRLKVSGFPLSIDDFGTGYSSVRKLVELPFNEIKLDRSFIIELENDEKSRAIVKATAEMAKSLRYKLIVEGVETLQQLEFLETNDELIVQGYYFSKPLRIDELRQFVINGV